MGAPMRKEWSGARRIVVKIGSALLVEKRQRHAQGRMAGGAWRTISPRSRREGREVIVVSSGAIALGRRALGLPAGPLKLEESQAAAAVGQIAPRPRLSGDASPSAA